MCCCQGPNAAPGTNASANSKEAPRRLACRSEGNAGDRFEDGLLLRHSYRVSEVPEICGPNLSCRNRLWLPAERWDEAMRLVGAELRRPLVPEHSPTLAAVV